MEGALPSVHRRRRKAIATCRETTMSQEEGTKSSIERTSSHVEGKNVPHRPEHRPRWSCKNRPQILSRRRRRSICVGKPYAVVLTSNQFVEVRIEIASTQEKQFQISDSQHGFRVFETHLEFPAVAVEFQEGIIRSGNEGFYSSTKSTSDQIDVRKTTYLS